MIEIRITDTKTNQQKTVYPLEDFTIPYGAISENLQHQELTCNFRIEYDADIFALLVESEELRAVVYDNSKSVFTGIIKRDITFTDNGYPLPMDNISLAIEDNTSMLKETTDNEVAFINKKLAFIIQTVCNNCGIEIAENQIIKDITVEAFVLDKETSYLEPFSNLLLQYGYSFIFNGSGEFKLVDIMSQATSLVPISEDDIYSGLQVQKTNKRYSGIRLTYNTLIKKENEQVYWEGNSLDDNNQVVPITILKNQYYPYESDPIVEASEGQVFQTFENGYAESYQMYNGEQKYRRSSKTILVYTENHKIIKDWDGTLSINRTDFGAKQASVRLLNESSKDVKLYQLAIRADAYYRSDDVILNYGKTKNPYKYEAEYIFNSTAAESFAQFLSRFFVGANFKITMQSAVAMPVGTHVNINTGLSGFVCNAIITSCEYNCKEEKYKLTFLSYGATAVIASRFKKYSTNYGGFSLSQTIGKSISSITSQSYLSTSTLEPVNGYWSDEELSWERGKYLWVRTKIVYNSGDITFTGTMLVTNPDNNGIDSVVTEFAFSESRTEEPTDGWSTDSPEWENGRYIWLRTVTKLSNNTVQTSKPACVTGAKGETGSSLKYLGLLNETPVSAHEGEFFLAESDWTTSESGTLLLISGNALQLLNGTTLKTIEKSYQAGFIYYNDKGLWIQVTDKNDYRYISATNDLIKKGWKLSDNLQKVLDDADKKAHGYADSAENNAKNAAENYANNAEENAKEAAQDYANVAENNSREYTDGQIAEKSEAFLEITGGLDEAIQSVTGKVNDIADDSKLTPDEKLTLLKEWANLSEEYSVLIAESKNVTVIYNAYQTAFKALATYLNGNNTWTSGIPLWLQSNRLSTVEEISGETMRSKFAQYNSEKTKLVNAISDKYAENAQKKAETEAGRLAGAAEQNAKDAAQGYASSAEKNAKESAQGYASTAEKNAKTYADGLKTQQSEDFKKITDNLSGSITALQTSISDISSDSKLTPDEKMLILKDWEIILDEYEILTAEADDLGVSKTEYKNKFQALADWLNGGNPWKESSGAPVYISASRLATTEDITGSAMRSIFAEYNSEKTKLVNAISDKYAENAKKNAETEAGRLAGAAEQNAKDAAQGYASSAEKNAKESAQGYANTAEENAKEAAQEYANSAEENSKNYADSLSQNLSSVIQTLGSKYLGLCSALPANANNGEFFLAETAFQDTGADRALLLLNGTRLTLLNGTSLLLKKAYQASYIYVLVDGLWTQLTDRNDYRYISASNDLIKKGWKLSENLQVLLDGMDEDAREYALNAENSSKEYTDDEVSKQTAAFKTVTDNLEQNVGEVTEKVRDITSDNVLDPAEKLVMLKDWITVSEEYTVILAEARNIEVDATAFTNAYKAVAQSLNGQGIWTSGTPLWLQAQWLSVAEDLSEFGGGETIRKAFGTYNAEKTNLIGLISIAHANTAEENANEHAEDYYDEQIKRIAEDGKLTPFEKRNVLQKWQEITAEYTKVIANAESVNLPEAERTNYVNGYKNLGKILNSNKSWTIGTTPSWLTTERLNQSENLAGIDMNKVLADYTSAYEELAGKINAKLKSDSENYTDKSIEDLSLPDKFQEIESSLENKLEHIPAYLGPLDSAPDASPKDWYLNTGDGNLYQYDGKNWNDVGTYSPTNANLFTSAVIKDGLKLAKENGNAARYAVAWIEQIFTRNIVLQDTVSELKNAGWDEDIFFSKAMTGLFKLALKVLDYEGANPYSILLIDQLVTGYTMSNSFEAVTNDKGDARIGITGEFDMTTFKQPNLQLRPNEISCLSGGNYPQDLLWRLFTNDNCLFIDTPRLFVKREGTKYNETLGLGVIYSERATNCYCQIFADGIKKAGGKVNVTSDFQQVTFSKLFSEKFSFTEILTLQLTLFNQTTTDSTDTNYEVHPVNITTAGFQIRYRDSDSTGARTGWVSWEVTGY